MTMEKQEKYPYLEMKKESDWSYGVQIVNAKHYG